MPVQTHCKRSSGTDRAWFATREAAEAFALDPANPAYHSDVVTFCSRCGFFHLSHPDWLEHLPWETVAKDVVVQ